MSELGILRELDKLIHSYPKPQEAVLWPKRGIIRQRFVDYLKSPRFWRDKKYTSKDYLDIEEKLRFLQEQNYITERNGNLFLTKNGSLYSKFGFFYLIYRNFIFRRTITSIISGVTGFIIGFLLGGGL